MKKITLKKKNIILLSLCALFVGISVYSAITINVILGLISIANIIGIVYVALMPVDYEKEAQNALKRIMEQSEK